MGMSNTTKILMAFCQQEIFGDFTELAQYLIDAEDEDCPIKFVDNSEADKLELKAEELALKEPDQYVDYDAWAKWEEETIELEAEIEMARRDASLELLGASEWWLCSKELGEKLKEHEEIVVFYNGLALWGRRRSGYDPVYDKIIKDIATEIEILPGMSHDWSKHI